MPIVHRMRAVRGAVRRTGWRAAQYQRPSWVRAFSSAPGIEWSTCDPKEMGPAAPAKLLNLVDGQWTSSQKTEMVVDPMSGEPFIEMPDTQVGETQPFLESLRKVPKSGLHNPLKSPERYNLYADVCFAVAAELRKPEVEDFFVRCIQRTMPKSHGQALAEVRVTRRFIETFAGDGVRFMARGFSVSGDHAGQESKGYRWPFGPVAIVAPFNFPFEIPVLQLMGALFMGNKPVIKGSPQVSLVLEQFIRLLVHCGMPASDVDLLHGGGEPMQKIITDTPVQLTQFTGSSTVAEKLLAVTNGKVKVEDAGFDWKIVGPDIGSDARSLEYVAWVCDQDAYACSGQKCSAQSVLFTHSNAVKAGLLEQMKTLAARRRLDDLTIGPVLSWTTERMLDHMNQVLAIPGAELLFGGKPLQGHSIPECYGAIEPTAVKVPLKTMLASEDHFRVATTELFGPFQIVVEYCDGEIDDVLTACEKMSHHLTAAVVSSDVDFVHHVLSNTVNGTTYAGLRGRTTGAPTNHWFGPAGNPNGAGIGTPEAIRLVWSCHREIIQDTLKPPANWTLPGRPT